MRTTFGPHGAEYWPLTSLCLRYPVAMPSVWLRKSTGNFHRLNDFGFDYPLNSNCYSCWYLNTAEVLCAGLLSEAVAGRVGCWFRSENPACISDSLLNVVAFRSVNAEEVATCAVSCSVQSPWLPGHQWSVTSYQLFQWEILFVIGWLHTKSRTSRFRNAFPTSRVSDQNRWGV